MPRRRTLATRTEGLNAKGTVVIAVGAAVVVGDAVGTLDGAAVGTSVPIGAAVGTVGAAVGAAVGAFEGGIGTHCTPTSSECLVARGEE